MFVQNCSLQYITQILLLLFMAIGIRAYGLYGWMLSYFSGPRTSQYSNNCSSECSWDSAVLPPYRVLSLKSGFRYKHVYSCLSYERLQNRCYLSLILFLIDWMFSALLLLLFFPWVFLQKWVSNVGKSITTLYKPCHNMGTCKRERWCCLK